MFESIQELDAEIARLDAAMAELVLQKQVLQMRRNSLVSINRCPDEILVEILRNRHVSEVLAKDCRHSPVSLTTLPRVCARWRAVISSSPCLWSLLDLDYSPTAVQRMLTLSAAHDLELWADISDLCYDSVCETLAKIVHSAHGTRVRVIEIKNNRLYGDVNELVDELVHLTNLQRFTLHRFTASVSSHLVLAPVREIPHLFRLASPSSPADLWILPSLVSLKLWNVIVASSGELLSFLQANVRNCPNLKNLEIYGISPRDLDWPSTDEKVHVRFPSLKTVTIGFSSPQMLNAAVSFLLVPTTCTIRLIKMPTSTHLSSTTFTGIRMFATRHQWTINDIELRVFLRGIEAFVRFKLGDVVDREYRMSVCLDPGRLRTDWEDHQTSLRSLWELFPRENLLCVGLLFAKTRKDPVQRLSPNVRRTGEAWPVADVLADLLTRVTPQLRAIVTDNL